MQISQSFIFFFDITQIQTSQRNLTFTFSYYYAFIKVFNFIIFNKRKSDFKLNFRILKNSTCVRKFTPGQGLNLLCTFGGDFLNCQLWELFNQYNLHINLILESRVNSKTPDYSRLCGFERSHFLLKFI